MYLQKLQHIYYEINFSTIIYVKKIYVRIVFLNVLLITNMFWLFTIKQHELAIISADGYDVEPFSTDAVILSGGERFDVIIYADKPVGNYWIRVETTATKTKERV